MHSDPLALFSIAIGVAAGIAFTWGWHAHPIHRKGCVECAADQRRLAEAERERRHDMQHRGPKAPGMPYPTEDIWECIDKTCPRNADAKRRLRR